MSMCGCMMACLLLSRRLDFRVSGARQAVVAHPTPYGMCVVHIGIKQGREGDEEVLRVRGITGPRGAWIGTFERDQLLSSSNHLKGFTKIHPSPRIPSLKNGAGGLRQKTSPLLIFVPPRLLTFKKTRYHGGADTNSNHPRISRVSNL